MSSLLRRHAVIAIGVALTITGAAHARGELRDPTRPPDAAPADRGAARAESAWTLTAILVAQGRRIAVVNGRPVQTGEAVGEATVKHIARERVVLATRKGDLTLKLVQNQVKQPEAARP